MRLVVVPPVPALLARYAGLTDPVAELRAACREAVAWLLESGPGAVGILGDQVDVERGVAQELLGEAGYAGSVVHGSGARPAPAAILLLNGSARRGEKAPGHLDERSFGFDDQVAAALAGDVQARAGLDLRLAEELMAAGVRSLRELDLPAGTTVVDYADDPYGVQYWVVRRDTDG